VRARRGGEFTVDRVGFGGARVETPEEAREAVRAAIARARRRTDAV
jgi:hypothetical protein